jgi:hypothetical protein
MPKQPSRLWAIAEGTYQQHQINEALLKNKSRREEQKRFAENTRRFSLALTKVLGTQLYKELICFGLRYELHDYNNGLHGAELHFCETLVVILFNHSSLSFGLDVGGKRIFSMEREEEFKTKFLTELGRLIVECKEKYRIS